MHVGLYAAKVHSRVVHARESIEKAYETYPDRTQFWCFIDLKDSTNYRITYGPKDGYIRGETFFSLIAEIISACGEVQLIKEIGDAVLLCSPDFRPLLESVILAGLVSHSIADVSGDAVYPFGLRFALGHGTAKRLRRRTDDYIGSCIDRLSRIASQRDGDILIDDNAYTVAHETLDEYKEFLTVSASRQLNPENSKGMVRPAYYRQITIDRAKSDNFQSFFVPWKNQVEQTSRSQTSDQKKSPHDDRAGGS